MVSHPETGSDSPIGSDRDRGRDRLSTLPCWSCILGGLAWLLLVFRVDTISH